MLNCQVRSSNTDVPGPVSSGHDSRRLSQSSLGLGLWLDSANVTTTLEGHTSSSEPERVGKSELGLPTIIGSIKSATRKTG